MQLTDEALVLSLHPFGEQDAIVTVFGREHGLLRGMVKRALSSKQRGIFCPGNTVELTWKARLEEHLGTMTADLIAPGGNMILAHRLRCYGLQAMCALVAPAFEQRDAHPTLFMVLEQLIEAMRFDLPWQADYARFEAVLLREAGYGLGLESCVVTGQRHDLRYVSPKSGCAVSAEEGAPYQAKLFDYPALLIQDMHMGAPDEEVLASLRVTGHFLENWLFASLEKPMPVARERLMIALKKAVVAPAC